jgi:hypothetical protein
MTSGGRTAIVTRLPTSDNIVRRICLLANYRGRKYELILNTLASVGIRRQSPFAPKAICYGARSTC